MRPTMPPCAHSGIRLVAGHRSRGGQCPWPVVTLVLTLGVVLVSCCLLAAGAFGQTKGGPTKYAPVPEEGDVKAALEKRIKEWAEQKQLTKKVAEILKATKNGKDIKLNPELLKKPEVQKKLKEFVDKVDINKLKKSVEDQQTAEDFLKKMEKPPEPPPPDPMKNPETPDPPMIPDQPPVPPVPEMESATDPLPPPTESSDTFDQFSDGLMKFLGPDLARSVLENESLQEKLLMMDWSSPQASPKILGFDPPDVSRLLGGLPKLEWSGLPKLSFSNGDHPSWGFKMPNIGALAGPAAADAGGFSAGSVVLVVVLLVGLALIVGLLLVGTRWARVVALRPWHPGPWPVDPARISTPKELVRAFNHLALLLLGRRAEHLNHRAVAAAVGNPATAAPERRQAADQLAQLYEQARYAPPAETLSPEDIAQARTDLCSLAGAAHA